MISAQLTREIEKRYRYKSSTPARHASFHLGRGRWGGVRDPTSMASRSMISPYLTFLLTLVFWPLKFISLTSHGWDVVRTWVLSHPRVTSDTTLGSALGEDATVHPL